MAHGAILVLASALLLTCEQFLAFTLRWVKVNANASVICEQ